MADIPVKVGERNITFDTDNPQEGLQQLQGAFREAHEQVVNPLSARAEAAEKDAGAMREHLADQTIAAMKASSDRHAFRPCQGRRGRHAVPGAADAAADR